jgi:crotonobetainyl-CoA:carnitine CoA-transferase CaiB-like acyl-CoA transferase
VQALKMLTTEGMLPPVLLSAQESRTAAPAPSLGQHTAAVLADLGYNPAEVDELRKEGVV